jgi:hypothetical protein
MGCEVCVSRLAYPGVMQEKQTPEDKPKDKPTRTDQARPAAEEYADDQREIIKKLRKPLN